MLFCWYMFTDYKRFFMENKQNRTNFRHSINNEKARNAFYVKSIQINALKFTQLVCFPLLRDANVYNTKESVSWIENWKSPLHDIKWNFSRLETGWDYMKSVRICGKKAINFNWRIDIWTQGMGSQMWNLFETKVFLWLDFEVHTQKCMWIHIIHNSWFI